MKVSANQSTGIRELEPVFKLSVLIGMQSWEWMRGCVCVCEESEQIRVSSTF